MRKGRRQSESPATVRDVGGGGAEVSLTRSVTVRDGWSVVRRCSRRDVLTTHSSGRGDRGAAWLGGAGGPQWWYSPRRSVGALERPSLSEALHPGGSPCSMKAHPPQGSEPRRGACNRSRCRWKWSGSGGDPVGDGSRGVVRCAPLQSPGHSNNMLQWTGGERAGACPSRPRAGRRQGCPATEHGR